MKRAIGLLLALVVCGCEGQGGEPEHGADASATATPEGEPGAGMAAHATQTAAAAAAGNASASAADAGAGDAAATAAGGGSAMPAGFASTRTPVAGPAGPLSVAFFLPEGLVRRDAPVAIGFDRPIVPLTQVDDDVDVPWLTLEPATPFHARWVDPQTLVVTPDAPLPLARSFVARMASGVAALDGTMLAQGREIAFHTANLQVETIHPGYGVVSRTSGILLVFSLPIGLPALQKHLVIEGSEKLPPWKIEIPADADALTKAARHASVSLPERAADLAGRAAIVRFAAPLPGQAKVDVRVTPGLRPLLGDRGTEKEKAVQFQTHGPMAIEAVRCANGCDPGAWLPFEVAFTTSIDGEERDGLRDFFRIEPDVGALRVSCWGTTCHLGGKLLPDTRYQVHVLPGLRDVYGQTLAEGTVESVTTGPLEGFTTLRTEGSVLERAEAPWEVAFSLRNEDADVRLEVVDVARWRQLESRSNVFSFGPGEPDKPFLSASARVLHLSPKTRNKAELFRVDLGRELGLAGPALVAIEWIRAADLRGRRVRELSLMQITDMHLHARSWDGGALVWVTSWSTGRPVPGVEVEIRDGAGARRFVGKTDASGLVTVPLDPNGNARGTPSVLATHGDDHAMLELGWRHHEGGGWGGRERARSVAFFEKDLFSAGETAHLKGIVRRVEPGGLARPAKVPVTVTLRDPEGKVVRTVKTRISAFGTFDAALELPAEPRYGTWHAEAELRDRGEEIRALATFRVAVYEPARTRAGLSLAGDHLLIGQSLAAEVRGEWLSGGPMRGAQVVLRALGEAAEWRPSGWDRFEFADQIEDPGPARAPLTAFEFESSGQLGDDGTLRVDVPAGSPQRVQSVLFEATVTDPSGRAQTEHARAWLQPSERAAGIAMPSRVAAAGAPLLIDAVAVGLDSKQDAAAPLALRLLHRTWKSVRAEQVGGTWEWQTTVEDREVERCTPTVVEEAGARMRRCALTPDRAGAFIVEATVSDAAGRSRRARTMVWVSGPEAVSWNPDAREESLLVADKASYKPGETAVVLLKNPLPGAMALITEDRGGILRQRIVPLPDATARLEIPIGADARPNLFVSAVVFRGRQRKGAPGRLDQGAPVLRTGAIELEVDASDARLAVAVDAGSGFGEVAKAGPGDEVDVRVRVVDAAGVPQRAEVALLVVDEGVLALTGYQTPDPFAPLWARHAHGVRDYALAGVLVRRRVGEEKGDMGGGGDESGALVRGNFRDVAHYAPALHTSRDGIAHARFRLPDNLTAFRVMAIAVAGDEAAGSGQNALRVAKPLMLQPRLPRYAQVGDQVEASVTIRSAADAPALRGVATASLRCTDDPAPLGLNGATKHAFELAPGAATEARFLLDASRVGACTLLVRAEAGGDSDAAELPLRVHDRRPAETSVVFGRTEEPVRQTLVRPVGSTDAGSLTVEVATSGVVGLRGEIEPLVDYPYGCAEQTASRLVALVEVQRLQREYGLFADRSPDSVQAAVQAAVERLNALRQGWPRGAMRLWPGASHASPQATAWAAVALAMAQERGAKLPAKMLSEAGDYLTAEVNRKHRAPGSKATSFVHSAVSRAEMLFALAVLGRAADADLGVALADADALRRDGKLALILALAASSRSVRREQGGKLLDAILATLRIEAAAAWLPETPRDGWSSTRRDRGMLLAAMARLRPEHPLLDRLLRGVADDHTGAEFGSTQEHAWSLLGIGAVLAVVEKTPPELDVTVRVGEAVLGAAHFSGRSGVGQRFELAQRALQAGAPTPVAIERQGQGPLYWGLRYRYVQPEVAASARNAGFVVRRTIVDEQGRSDPDAMTRGAMAVVTVEVWSGRERRDVAIVDPLPATLEAVDFELQGQPEIVRRKLAPADDDLDAWTPPLAHRELTPMEVRFFADRLPAGKSVFHYVVRARSRGRARWDGSRAEAMYAPEVFGRAAAGAIEVR
ncbi:MAG: hypothetical protein H6747_15670 [Deltaproteobacteria bacterium]|nr:hypothetical protein [Deltaproteobacteria bacterium]